MLMDGITIAMMEERSCMRQTQLVQVLLIGFRVWADRSNSPPASACADQTASPGHTGGKTKVKGGRRLQ